jgi:general secretion pathway protein G
MRAGRCLLLLPAVSFVLLGCCSTHGSRTADENVLKQDLFALRASIDSYTMDKRKAPQALSELVSAGYLRVLPKDPTTGKPDWVPIEDDTLMTADQTAPGISDVHSASHATACDGTQYSNW